MAPPELKAAAPTAIGRRRSKNLAAGRATTPKVNVALFPAFFLLTTAFANPYLTQPTELEPARPAYVDEADALTIILGKNHRVHYYFGLNQPGNAALPGAVLKTTALDAPSFRRLLLDHQRRDPVAVHIKPGPGSQYPDMVAALAQMRRTHQRQYALATLTPDDLTLLKTAAL